jgi:hypothetical protein
VSYAPNSSRVSGASRAGHNPGSPGIVELCPSNRLNPVSGEGEEKKERILMMIRTRARELPTRVTRDEILAKRTPAGGWTAAQLAEWGVSWPPRKGWINRLAGGAPCAPAPATKPEAGGLTRSA